MRKPTMARFRMRKRSTGLRMAAVGLQVNCN
jgi:hypothetical protein